MHKGRVETAVEGMVKGTPDPCIIVIFGASGDLSHRELVPSLYALHCNGLLPHSFAVVGFSRPEWTDRAFRDEMKQVIRNYEECSDDEWRDFADHMYYIPGDFNDDPDRSYATLRDKLAAIRKDYHIPDNLLFHLATPPRFYETIVQKLASAALTGEEEGWRRVILEKPFGEDESSARALDRKILTIFREEQVFRVDHFLGKETVQNMLVVRFANPAFEPVWNRNYIDHVQITVAEDIGIGGRGEFYDSTGVLADMVQNHLFQLLCITAIEPPVHYDKASLRTESYKVLDAMSAIAIKQDVVLGQYDRGRVDGQAVSAYRKEKHVAPDSETPTYAALKVMVDNWRWAGVPFYLRTGKRMPRRLAEVRITFNPTPHLMFPDQKNRLYHNTLTFRLQPDEGIQYTLLAKQPGAELQMRPVDLNFTYSGTFGVKDPPSAYQWLLFDAMKGDETLFPRADWIYKSWSILDPVIQAWKSGPWKKMPNYAAGTWGPKEADEMLRRDGRSWVND